MDWSQSQAKLYRALLYCYPSEFRHEYGGEMEQLFTDRLHSESRLRVWLETIADLGFSAPKEHGHILFSDLLYGARVFAAAPGFTLTALLVIALGIGATVSVFSVVYAVLLRSLPYGHPSSLVYLWSPNRNFKGVPDELGPNLPDFYVWQRTSHSFSSMAVLQPFPVNLVREGSTSRVEAASVTAGFFRTLDAWPAMGRSLDASDDRPGHERVAVISDELWRSQFGASPGVIGQHLQLNRHDYTVVGVMPKDFGYPFDGDIPYEHTGVKQTDIWMPAAYSDKQKTDRTNFASADAIARLRDGVTLAQAQAELAAIESRLDPLYPEMWRGWRVLLGSLVQTIVGPVQKMLWLLLAAVSFVLLIAVSNVANLLLARATSRAHELGIRTALGAERARIIRQLLTESLMLSCAGGAIGIALAFAAVRLLIRLNPGDIPRFDSAGINVPVLLIALALSLAAGALAGLIPAIRASNISINQLLRSGGSRLTGSSHRGRFALITLQVALSVVLLTGSTLLIRSYLRVAAVDPGFSPSTVVFSIRLDERYNTPESQTALYKAFLEKLQNIRGVTFAGASNATPLSHEESVSAAEILGYGASKEMMETRSITPGYRKALGSVLLRGRDLDSHDVTSKTPVVMVNQKFADTYFRGRDPLGGQLRTGIGDLSKTPWSTVVGVIGNIRHNSLEEASQPQIFQPAATGDNFAIQCSLPARQAIEQARAALRALDPVLTLENPNTMRERMTDSNARRTFQTSLLTCFAAIAVTLALVGLYGLMSFAVKQRTAEIGVRLSVGSSRTQVLWLILSQGLRVTAVGLVLGLAGAFAAGRLLAGWLFGVAATDPLTFIAVPLFVLAVAAGASLIPAWSATRIDPVEALRQE